MPLAKLQPDFIKRLLSSAEAGYPSPLAGNTPLDAVRSSSFMWPLLWHGTLLMIAFSRTPDDQQDEDKLQRQAQPKE